MRSVAAMVIAALLAAAPAAAQEASEKEPHVTVTASRRSVADIESPYATSAVEGDDIAHRRAVRTLPEAFQEEPQVSVQKTGRGQGSPFIRGFTGFRTLLLIDGVRLNNSTFRDGPNQYWGTVDPLALERIELVEGPSSVLYGSDAVGGTAQAIARGPRIDRDGVRPRGRLLWRYGGAERSQTGRAEGGVEVGKTFGAIGGITLRDFGDLDAGRHQGTLENTGYRQMDGDAKAVLALTDALRLIGAYQQNSQQNAPRTHATIFSQPYRGTDVGGDLKRDFDQRRQLAYVQLRIDAPGAIVDEGLVGVSWHRQQERQTRHRTRNRLRIDGFTVDQLGLQAALSSEVGPLRATYGIEHYRDLVDSFAWDRGATLERGPVADDATYDLFGGFVELALPLLDERLEVTVGGRYTYADVNAREVDPDPFDAEVVAPIDERFSSLVGNLRARFAPVEALSVWAGAAQAFRAPNLSDLTRFDVALSGEVETPVDDLDPERFVTLEAGVKLDRGTFRGEASYFHTFIRDMIVRAPTGRTIGGEREVTKRNAGDGFVHGVEARAALKLDFALPIEGVSLLGAFGWTEGEAKGFPFSAPIRKSEPLSQMPPAKGIAGVRYEAFEGRLFAEAVAIFVREQHRLSSIDERNTQRIPPRGTPGYAVVALRVGGEPWEHLRMSLSVENVADRDYRIHVSGQNEPGTNAIVTIELSW